MHQAHTEARAEAEAAAKRRVAAALAIERAELVNQARSWLCMCGMRNLCCTALGCHALLHCLCNQE